MIKAVQKEAENCSLSLNSFVTVADAKKCQMYMKNFGEFYNNQIEYAGTIILSRTGQLQEEKLQKAVELIREHNQKAAVITTPWEELDGEKILSVMEEGNQLSRELFDEEEICPECGHHHEHGEDHHHEHEHHHHHEHEHGDHHHHHADEVFTSWGIETLKKFKEETLEKILKQLSEKDSFGTILRAKGIVESEDKSWIHFDLVPGEYEIRRGDADYTGRICVIGAKLDTEKIQELFGLS